ncbi:MAG: patatin-like phospholipase family protein [candidate division Zixibacteria bacterium]|nr:patatin-like phospholipase family protein [candidate division Zixibacteria bacterium]
MASRPRILEAVGRFATLDAPSSPRHPERRQKTMAYGPMTHSLLSPAPTWRRIAACWFIALTVTAIQPSICRPASVADAPDSTQESRTVDLAADLHRTARPVFPGRPHVALALAGGGARGLAHIGVLRALEENHIGVDLICGTSMGAIIGGLYAAGIGPDSLETIVRAINWRDLLANTPSRASLLLSQKEKTDDWFVSLPLHGLRPQWPNGATSGQRLYNFLSSLTEDATYRSGSDFDSLPVRFRAVATDLVTGERVVLADGELASAMRASTAFPLAIAPLREGNRLLADGGLVDPLPVQLADSLSDGPVVAINTTSGLAAAGQLRDPYMLANQATSVMTAPRLSAALAEADFVCVPALGTVTNVDFGAVDTIIAIGYEAGQVLARQILANTHQDHDPAIQGTERDGQATDRHVLAQIQFHGNTAITDSALQSALEQKVDQPYDRGDLMASLRRLERLYARRHYTLAAITGANWDTTNGNLSIAIDEAPLAGVDLSGNRSVKSWVILRNFPLKTGSPYNARQVAQGLADLHATGLFDQITAEVTRTDKGPRLHLNVTEKTADALRLGLHHNLEYQSEGFIQWAKINLFGLGNELTARAAVSRRRARDLSSHSPRTSPASRRWRSSPPPKTSIWRRTQS